MEVSWLELSPDPMLMVDAEGRVLGANAASERLFGYPAGGLAGRSVDDLVPPSERAAHRRSRLQYASAPKPRSMGSAGLVLRGVRRDGGTFPADVSLLPATVDGRPVVLASVRDLSEREQREERERLVGRRAEAERARRMALIEATAAVRLAVLSGMRVPECLDLICAKAMELLNGSAAWITWEGGDDSAAGRCSPPPLGRPGCVLAARMRDSRGPIGTLTVARGPDQEFDDEEVAILDGLATEAALAIEHGRLRADRERKDLLEERERIARDLHDTVIQDLYATGMLLDATQSSCVDPVASGRISQAIDTLDGAIASLRSVLFMIDPPAASGAAAQVLRRVLELRAEQLGFVPVLQTEGDLGRLPDRVLAELVPAVNEALSNVARHSGASAVTVRLTADERGGWQLEVQDDGSGFRPGRVPLGRGLPNLGTRAELLAATLQIDSEPGRGTTIRLRSGPPGLS